MKRRVTILALLLLIVLVLLGMLPMLPHPQQQIGNILAGILLLIVLIATLLRVKGKR